MPNFYIPSSPIAAALGIVDDTWRRFFELLAATVTSQGASLSAVPGVNRFDIATQPALGASDEGYLGFETDTRHLLRWTGTVWEFAPGDVGNLFFRDFAGTPQESGWALCDGSTVDYLTVGATLTLTSITLPNLSGTAAYRKSAAAYTGSIAAAAGSSGATAPALSGSTATEGAHTHTGTTDNTANAVGDVRTVGAYDQYGFGTTQHSHTFTTGAGSAHSHGVGTLAVASHTHGPGTIDPAHLDVLPYFRL
jgi:hypothetical protein